MADKENMFMKSNTNKKREKIAEEIMNAGKIEETEKEVSADLDEVRPSQETKIGAGGVIVQKEGQNTDEELDNLAIVFKSKAKVKKVPINLSIRPTTKTKLQKMCKKTKMTNSDFVEQLILQIYDRMMGE